MAAVMKNENTGTKKHANKIILTSRGVNCQRGRLAIAGALKKIIGSDYKAYLADKTIVICTAAEDHAGQLLKNGAKMLGFSDENILIWDENVEEKYRKEDAVYDFCYVSEGNTFQIGAMLYQTGAAALIKKCMEADSCYIGASAGAILAGEIGFAEAFDRNRAGLRREEFDGLHILPPSLGSATFLPHMTKKIFAEWKRNFRPAYLLDEYHTLEHIPDTGYKIYDSKRNIFESHAHLDVFDKSVIGKVLSEAAAAGVSKIVVPAISFDSNFRMQELFGSEKYQGRIYLTVGVHPKEAVNLAFNKEKKQALEELMEKGNPAALKTGLDHSKTKLTEGQLANQNKWFRYFVLEAAKRKMPLIIHVRDAMEEFESQWQWCREELARLSEKLPEGEAAYQMPEAVVHCYNGHGAEQTKKLLQMGIRYFGIGGKVTQDDTALQEAVQMLPMENILLETDSPWVCPAEYEMPAYLKNYARKKTGKKMKYNTPATLPRVAEKIAELKGLETEEIFRITYENGCKFYRV